MGKGNEVLLFFSHSSWYTCDALCFWEIPVLLKTFEMFMGNLGLLFRRFGTPMPHSLGRHWRKRSSPSATRHLDEPFLSTFSYRAGIWGVLRCDRRVWPWTYFVPLSLFIIRLRLRKMQTMKADIKIFCFEGALAEIVCFTWDRSLSVDCTRGTCRTHCKLDVQAKTASFLPIFWRFWRSIPNLMMQNFGSTCPQTKYINIFVPGPCDTWKIFEGAYFPNKLHLQFLFLKFHREICFFCPAELLQLGFW